MDWQPIKTAPQDGTWFNICRASEGYESCEVGRYDPVTYPVFEPDDEHAGLFRKIDKQHRPLRTEH